MATFKPGQRVKKTCHRHEADRREAKPVSVPIGTLGTIGHPLPSDVPGEVSVLWDGYRSDHWTGELLCMPYQLVPLTPSAEDTWAADAVRRVTKPQPMIVFAPKQPHEQNI